MNRTEQNAQFSAWLRDYAAVLHHVAGGFADGADRQDLLQELMLAVWNAVPQFRGGSRVSTFIYRVAHNTALTWTRTERNYRKRVDRFETEQGGLTHSASDTGSGREAEALRHLYGAIRGLLPLERSLILLHLEGASYAEISELHGLTVSHVGVRLTRIKQKLTTALAALSHELR